MKQDMMMNAKKKALMELIKKMRGLEASSMGEEKEEPADEEIEEAIMPNIHDHVEEMREDDEDGKMVDSEGDGDDYAKERQAFMKRGGKLPIKGKTKAVMISVDVKPKAKMKRLGV